MVTAARRSDRTSGGSITSEQHDPLLLRVGEAATLLGIGPTLAYEMVGQGNLPHVRIGRAVRIPRRALNEWIEANTIGGPGTRGPRT